MPLKEQPLLPESPPLRDLAQQDNGDRGVPFTGSEVKVNTSERWLRFNTAWSDSDWLFDLSVGARLAWIELLCHTKRDGICGKTKAVSLKVASCKWRIPIADIGSMLTAAVSDNALLIADGYWTLTNWPRIQCESLERVKRFRKRKKETKKETTETGTHTVTVTRGVTHVTSETLHAVTPIGEAKASSVSDKPKRKLKSVELTPLSDFAVEKGNKWQTLQLNIRPNLTNTADDQMRGVQDLIDTGYTIEEIQIVLSWILQHQGNGDFRWFDQIRTLKKLNQKAPKGKAASDYDNWFEFFQDQIHVEIKRGVK